MDYSNLVIFAVLFFFPYAVKYAHSKTMKLLLCFLTFYTVKLTNSRSGLVLVLILIIIYLIFCKDKRIWQYIKKNKTKARILIAIILTLTLVIFHNNINGIVQRLLNQRAGSNSMRMFIYSSSIKKMLNESPLFGIGIKDLNVYGYPYGAHSSYIGALYKTGLIGGTIYVISIFLLDVNIALKKSKNNYDLIKKISLIFSTILMMIEDIDGANWNICIFFIFCAIFLNKADSKRIRSAKVQHNF